MDHAYPIAARCESTMDKISRKVRNDVVALGKGELPAQGLIEYVLIIAVISIAIIVFGPGVKKAIGDLFTQIVNTLNSAAK